MARVEIPLIQNLSFLSQEVVFKEYKHSLQSVSAPCIHVIPSSLLTYCVFFEIRIRRQESGKKIPDPLHLEAWSTFRVAFWCYVSPKIEHCRKDKNEYSFKYRGAKQEGGGCSIPIFREKTALSRNPVEIFRFSRSRIFLHVIPSSTLFSNANPL